MVIFLAGWGIFSIIAGLIILLNSSNAFNEILAALSFLIAVTAIGFAGVIHAINTSTEQDAPEPEGEGFFRKWGTEIGFGVGVIVVFIAIAALLNWVSS